MNICAITLNYFGWHDTAACCAALAEQDIDRIIVVENSADAREKQALQTACRRMPKTILLEPTKNLGFAGGVNYALREMIPQGYDAFLIINNDTIPPSDFVKKLRSGIVELCLDIAAPVIYRYPETKQLWSRGQYYNLWTGLITHNRLPLPGTIFYLPGCCLLIRHHVFSTVGLFDEDFFMYGEDVAFCHCAAQRGFRLGIVPDALLYHKTGSASGDNPLFYEEHIARAHLLLARKIFSPKKSLLVLSLKIPVLMLRAFYRSLRKGNIIALEGFLHAMKKECPHLRRYLSAMRRKG